MGSLKYLLDAFYREYNFREKIQDDPIKFPKKYHRPEDIEVVAYISSSFAYGRVDLFNSVIQWILKKIGSSPADFLYGFNIKKRASDFAGVKYRFNQDRDIIGLLYIIHVLLNQYGSIKNAFLHFFHDEIYDSLSRFIEHIVNINTSPVYGTDIRPSGFLHFFPLPQKGSACKRMHMFLRWMVRDSDIDFGLWREIPKNRLIIPLDTHISRIGRCLGFTKRKTNDWKTASEITEALKKLDPEDPLKYDFALCHHGISRACKVFLDRSTCRNCVLKSPYL